MSCSRVTPDWAAVSSVMPVSKAHCSSSIERVGAAAVAERRQSVVARQVGRGLLAAISSGPQ